jgi:hypothetical protein
MRMCRATSSADDLAIRPGTTFHPRDHSTPGGRSAQSRARAMSKPRIRHATDHCILMCVARVMAFDGNQRVVSVSSLMQTVAFLPSNVAKISVLQNS